MNKRFTLLFLFCFLNTWSRSFPMIVKKYQVISCHTFYYKSHLWISEHAKLFSGSRHLCTRSAHHSVSSAVAGWKEKAMLGFWVFCSNCTSTDLWEQHPALERAQESNGIPPVQSCSQEWDSPGKGKSPIPQINYRDKEIETENQLCHLGGIHWVLNNMQQLWAIFPSCAPGLKWNN